MNFFWRFWAARHISRANCAKFTDQDQLHMKCSALNVDFNGPSLDLLGSRKPARGCVKKRYPLKIVISPLLASLP